MISSTQTNQPFAIQASATYSSQSYIEAAIARLRSAGLRITQSRIRLLTELGRSGEPMTIEELHRAVGQKDCDLVTVYRTMAAFEAHDVVRRSYRHSGTTLFERKLGEPPRYRIVCKATNKVEEIDSEAALRLEETIRNVENSLRDRGFTHVSHVLEFFGVANDGSPEPAAAHARTC